MDKGKVCTILIPCFGRIELLKRCVRSFESCYQFVDILIVDDGSEVPIEREVFSEKSPVVVTRLNENSGRFCALKTGVSLIKTEYVMIFDSDDRWVGEPAIFEALVPGKAGWVFFTSSTDVDGKLSTRLLNYFELRYLAGLNGDLKEICNSDRLKYAFKQISGAKGCRVPTTLIWLHAFRDDKVTVDHKVVCLKEYLGDGMSRRSLFLRLENARFMFLLYDLVLIQAKSIPVFKLINFYFRRSIYFLIAKYYDPHN